MSRLHFSANKCFKLAPWPSLTKPSAAVAGPPTSTVTMPPWCSRSYTPLLLPTPVQGPPPPHKTLSFPLKHQVFFFSISFLSLFARSNTFWEQRQRKVCESRVECNLFVSWKTSPWKWWKATTTLQDLKEEASNSRFVAHFLYTTSQYNENLTPCC